MSQENFVDSYYMRWTLKTEQGEIINENFTNISLSDFEVIYGNNVYQIIHIEMRVIGG